MTLMRRGLLAAGAVTALAPSLRRRARAQAANTYRIGVLTDMSGTYRDNTGPTSVICVRQAVAEFASQGFNVEVIEADHQNRPDLGVSLARQWYDQGIDLIADVPTSSVGLAVQQVAREKNKAVLQVGSATADLTGAHCSPNSVHWAYDTYLLAKSTGAAMVTAGGDSWFCITADYAFGHALERDTSALVRASGGRVLGSVRTPFPGTTDFSSFLVQATAARPKVIGLANAGLDTINCVKQAAEFGVTRRGVKLACMLLFITDVHSIGLDQGAGLVLTESFYWALNDRSRAFLNRVKPRLANVYPNCIHAGNYSATLHALKAVADMGVPAARASGTELVNRMKAMPCDDDCFGPGRIREDGRKIHPSFLFEVKARAESKAPWDYLKLLQTTPAEEAFRPIAEGGCPLVRG
ncbi:ABC transporter substrate-binding protein [Siccirubricoccus sp. KC 17139]|uniref:ABC transporter substrate-binding protein n=1 Tax=Siccirubricoccus soli TaxID=2899147 RepID=A0ABT1D381_9PROT|nr:ABC transporter substrate-binding protein [Siccirubricoccus soli]MCO6415735.1 ABC transporter substrate-binding protein [Siccirubricoccus soli]MCP2681867.1 ABC transporter substrate-binding protein [Siccirubricoccus soli]